MGTFADHVQETISGDGTLGDKLHRFFSENPGGEIAYAEITANQASITALTDITGLSVTFTLTSPAVVELELHVPRFQNDTADADVLIIVSNGDASTNYTQARETVPKAAGYASMTAKARESLAAGTYTFKGRAQAAAGIGTVVAAAAGPAYLRVVRR